MNKEGNICMAVAEWAVREQALVLTIHDSFICAVDQYSEILTSV
jgi:hypothetical protein